MGEKQLNDPETYFWLRSGKGLRSVRELADELPSISKDEYAHHVTKRKNDFAQWLEDLFDEKELGAMLRKTKSREEFQTKLYNHVLQQKMKRPEKPRTDVPTEEEFPKYHEKKADEYDGIVDRFDEVITNFTESLNPEMAKEVESTIDQIQERYQELKQQISEARRSGKDPVIAEMLLRGVPAKLAYAKVTQEQKDFQEVKKIFTAVEKELKEALAFTEPNVKAEVEALVKKN